MNKDDIKSSYLKFLQAKMFLIEQQAMRVVNSTNTDLLRRSVKEIQEICASNIDGVVKRLEGEINTLEKEL